MLLVSLIILHAFDGSGKPNMKLIFFTNKKKKKRTYIYIFNTNKIAKKKKKDSKLEVG